MISITYAKRNFKKYVKQYDLKDSNINRKINHTYRVMEVIKKISKKENFSNKEIKLATIIALLHDIARFEQYSLFHTFKDTDSFDHGDKAIKILSKDDFIRSFIKTKKYDNIIFKSIRNHNKYQIENNLKTDEEKFAKLIRDADKIDIINEVTCIFWNSEEDEEKINNSRIEENIVECIINKRTVKRRKDSLKELSINDVLICLAMVFDINYKASFEILQKKQYINKVINRFRLHDTYSNKRLTEVNLIINNYIEKEVLNKKFSK